MFKPLEFRLPFASGDDRLALPMVVPNALAGEPQQQRPHVTDLSRLPLRDADGRLLMVVEAPAGSRLKLKYDPRLGAFTISRPLVLGLAYPFEWGFLPSTVAADGDPLDCMVLGDAPTYPGVVVPCRPIGVALYTQNAGGPRAHQHNDRILAVPCAAPCFATLKDARKLPERIRDEIEAFFACAALLEDKGLRFVGWDGPKAAERLISQASAAFAG